MITPDKIYDKAMAAADEWADLQHAAGVLSDGLDALKGQIAAELKSKGEKATLIPSLVKNDQRYKDMALQVRDAEKLSLISKLKYEQINRWQDNYRTSQVTERALAR